MENKNNGETRNPSLAMLMLLMLILLFLFLYPSLIENLSLSYVLRQIVHISIMSFGATMVIMLGQINVAYGSVMALTGCIACKMISETGQMLPALAIALLCGAAIGFLNGFLIVCFEISSFIVTMVMNMIIRGVAMVLTNSAPILDIGGLRVLSHLTIGGVSFMTYIMMIFLALSWFILNKTCFGRQVIAVGENQEAARVSGINPDKVIIETYIIDGLFTAVAGILYMARMNSGLPDASEVGEFDVITSVVIGGTSLNGGSGNVFGTLIGCVFVGYLNYILNLLSLNTNWQNIIKGLLIFGFIIFDYQMNKRKRKYV